MMALDSRKTLSLSAKLAQVPTLLSKMVSVRNVDNVGSNVLCLTLDAYHSLRRNLLVRLLRVVRYQVITATPSPDKTGARRDEDGYYWITGRVDDMLNVSGHLISTAQIESALLAIPDLSEAAAVPRPHKVKGQCLYCYVVLKDGKIFSEDLKTRLKQSVRSKIGAFADPEYIHSVERLPKTRSGKVMRRILRKIACNELEFGDVSALSEQDVISELLQSKCFIQNKNNR